jgi:hypothetical protein
VFALAGALTALGVGLHGSMRLCRAKRWLKFEGQQRGQGGSCCCTCTAHTV